MKHQDNWKKYMQVNMKAESLVKEGRGRSVLMQQLPIWEKGSLSENWTFHNHPKWPLALAPTPILFWLPGTVFLALKHKTSNKLSNPCVSRHFLQCKASVQGVQQLNSCQVFLRTITDPIQLYFALHTNKINKKPLLLSHIIINSVTYGKSAVNTQT